MSRQASSDAVAELKVWRAVPGEIRAELRRGLMGKTRPGMGRARVRLLLQGRSVWHEAVELGGGH